MDARKKLIEAAERCLLEKGSHAASIKTIAAMAGVNHGLVHHYFGSKEGLFIAVATSHFDKVKDPPFVSGKTEDILVDYLQETVIQNSKLMIEMRSLSFHMPELDKALELILVGRRKRLERILDIDELKAILLLSAVSGLGFHSSLDKSLDVKVYIKKIVSLLLSSDI